VSKQEKLLEKFRLHKPHPENDIKGGALKDIKASLKKDGIL
jgi:hypothetical protein